jgi:hypothetical protein
MQPDNKPNQFFNPLISFLEILKTLVVTVKEDEIALSILLHLSGKVTLNQ